MKWLLCLLAGVLLGAVPAGILWETAAKHAQAEAELVNAVLAAQRDHQRALADSALAAMRPLRDSIGALKSILAQQPPVSPRPQPPADSTIRTLLAAIADRDVKLDERDAAIRSRDDSLSKGRSTAERLEGQVAVAGAALARLRDSLATSPARPCPAPLPPPHLPGLSIELAAFTGPGVSTDFSGHDPRLGWNVGIGLAAKVPLRKLVPRFLR